MGAVVDSVDLNLERPKGPASGFSMNMCAVFLAGAILSGAFAGWNSYYFEELFSALLLFALVALPLLALAFTLAVAEAGAERGMPWAKARTGELAASLRCLAQTSRQRLLPPTTPSREINAARLREVWSNEGGWNGILRRVWRAIRGGIFRRRSGSFSRPRQRHLPDSPSMSPLRLPAATLLLSSHVEAHFTLRDREIPAYSVQDEAKRIKTRIA
jgi:hypothetical protein